MKAKVPVNSAAIRSFAPPKLPRAIRLGDGRSIKLPALMGILNVTPDSFSDGGMFLDPGRATEHAMEMAAAGADVIDVGGESTRPSGARALPVEIELERLRPVLRHLGAKLRVPFSIDTRHAAVAEFALDCGAAIINDVSALTADPEMAPLAARAKCPVVLMHMRGGPGTHMNFARYRDVVREVIDYLSERAAFAVRAGIRRSRIIVDPGLGFAKTAEHNLKLLAALPRLCALGYPVLVGASRKRFIRRIAGADPRDVEFGTAAVDTIALARGASILRVHDARSEAAVMRMAAAMNRVGGKRQLDE